jgi:RNA polymerase sigma-70 factor (ECF subfamily)
MADFASDQELINAVCAHSAPAAEAFVARYRPLVAGLAVSRFNYSADAVEDLFNQLIVMLWDGDLRALRAWRGRGRFSTYLTVILLHLCQKQQQLAARQQPLDEAALSRQVSCEPQPEQQAATDQGAEHLHRALATLPPRDRLLIRWRYFDDCSPSHIGRLLGISGGTARKAVFDAVRRLRKRYQVHLNNTD